MRWGFAIGACMLIVATLVAKDPAVQRLVAAPTNTPVSARNTSLVAPVVAQDFFSAFCAKDAKYLAANTGGALTMTEEDLAAYFATTTLQCHSFRYLGSLTPTPGTVQYVYVVDAGEQGELWYVLSVTDGIAVDLQ